MTDTPLPAPTPPTASLTPEGIDPALAAQAPSTFEAIALNLGLVAVLVLMFYLLLIRPQQKRFKEHNDMLKALGKGEKIVTQAGFVGTITDLVSDHEIRVELAPGLTVTMLKSAISGKYADLAPTEQKK